jgi:hypothetical protein
MHRNVAGAFRVSVPANSEIVRVFTGETVVPTLGNCTPGPEVREAIEIQGDLIGAVREAFNGWGADQVLCLYQVAKQGLRTCHEKPGVQKGVG